MPSLRDIKRRIKSVSGIRQITRAMEMVSATKLRRAQQRIEAARPYTEKMDEILAHLGETVQAGIVHHPLMEPREEVRKLLIVAVASDKGLCGSFNANIIRSVRTRAGEAEAEGVEVSLLLIGRKPHDFFKRRRTQGSPLRILEESDRYRSIDQQLHIDFLQELTDLCTDAFESGKADQVDVIYTEFRSAISHKIVARQFLPIVGLVSEAEEPPQARGLACGGHPGRDYIFEPDPDRLFAMLIPKYARVMLFRMLADSLASEHAGRMTAMRNATENAGDMIKSLTLQRNKARQAAITKELAEIIAGAEALRA